MIRTQETPPGFRNFPQGDQRIMEYGVGEDVPIGGVAGLGSGISHYVRRVSEANLARIPSPEEYKRIKEEQQRRVREREDKLRPFAQRWHHYMSGSTPERNARSIYKSLSGNLENLPEDVQRDIDSVEYTEDPTIGMLEIDIDRNPININKLIEAGLRYAKTPSDEDIIDAVFKLFIATEEEKVKEAYPPTKSMQNHIYTMQLRNRMSQHMMEKLPKIQTVLNQVKARLSIQSNLSNLSSPPSKNVPINLPALYGAAPPPAAQPLAPLEVPRPQSPGPANFGGRRKTYRRKTKKSKRSKAKTKRMVFTGHKN
uniref:Uncharacterized protein n=1 Tax=viral metagenome TaxID=1070528 RepID=A0A6C0KB37_9ZZZZ